MNWKQISDDEYRLDLAGEHFARVLLMIPSENARPVWHCQLRGRTIGHRGTLAEAQAWCEHVINHEVPRELRSVNTERDKLRKQLQVFADFADPRRLVPRSFAVTTGSPYAKRQLTMGDFYDAADLLKAD